MKLYNAQAPNPWRVRVFLAEKGVEVPRVDLEFSKGDTRTPGFLKLNPLGKVPVLELDDGGVLTESVAICRYLEALYPAPPLFGTTPGEQARIEMWSRRIELEVLPVIGGIGLHTLPFFADRLEQVPAYAEAQKRALPAQWAWLDGALADRRPFLAGKTFTVADITGMVALKVSDIIELPVPRESAHVKAWEARVRGRESWAA